MEALRTTRRDGWSYLVGQVVGYEKPYYARAWKSRPYMVRTIHDVELFQWCVSAVGDSEEEAASKCAALVAACKPDSVSPDETRYANVTHAMYQEMKARAKRYH